MEKFSATEQERITSFVTSKTWEKRHAEEVEKSRISTLEFESKMARTNGSI